MATYLLLEFLGGMAMGIGFFTTWAVLDIIGSASKMKKGGV